MCRRLEPGDQSIFEAYRRIVEVYPVYAWVACTETACDSSLVYADVKECVQRSRGTAEGTTLHKTQPNLANGLAAPGLSRVLRRFESVQTYVHQALLKLVSPQNALRASPI